MVVSPDWIAVDWGTTRLRVWAMRGATVIEARSSDKGMGQLSPDGFQPALLELVSDWLDTRPPVIACGMVGARTGWAEADYRSVPCPPLDPARATRPPVSDPRLDVHILPGLSQIDPPDVMRGEETQIAGFLAEQPDFDGTLCLPGTHCKWVRIADGAVQGFHTFMTGEVYSLIARQSVLRLTIGDAQPDAVAFLEAAAQALANPDLCHAGLFPLRAAALLNGLDAAQGAGRLSGLLIGAELAAARPLWLDRRTVIIGAPELAALYQRALAQAGADAVQMDGAALVLAGLTAARAAITRTT
ncbi:2-dehydro-3-deoxygalactonokinase [Paracoccus laeviglucosivorans]|uniref:2-keto-3-deoxygalactonate kinase n=1 Tax=Paracoccus laeviglucosivorans TaxID=1197861 RepID=A0A521DK09_9RHOB|nr:2-dehydro-3-deoxygalactonokinase [Paracoccus laeviglucosivorans]SMO71421.1 2-keto-3-deoxygalactonate kinase [Paracoccus laeviglucosivorans]